LRSEERLTQRASLGAAQLISQRRPRELVLHVVVPPPSALVLLVVLVVTLASPPPLLLLLVVVVVDPEVVTLVLLLTLLSMLTLLDVEAAPTPFMAKQSRRAKEVGNLMTGLQRFGKDEKRGRSPLISEWHDRCTHCHL
jgi:hypothetical protein